MQITKNLSANLLLLALACVLSLTACKQGSTKPFHEATIKQQPVRVSCKLGATPITPAPPHADQWVESTPVVTGGYAARLSETAVSWVRDVLGLLDKERKLRKEEHACLDNSEKAGLIQQ